ncbi:aminotransferase class V-fold PLP-dependent enzyme [Flavobacterium sp. GT3R68]|uniref:aminotransferase class V-fold PLP-dependent enzyme n=1 Tax=Flavobacterium sp. GT3R68 TaxID=2594437 RepID=UPI000F85F9B2|nr:aminotransferase class V-fold PLP-dependent enzyme [Flavobacterium sp. GT3R68]RTY92522.1 aminotransferase class V-fold PLP-dependent enzyme [Flavobacterium sp. GSN2]TRW94148.1 aminotransferase class V-fold PLP-dependent enzyme [Flavobacterium sp. GT3R68]
MKSQFLLNPEITYLNHGSFGACPKTIFDNYQYFQLELEKEPVQFITKKSVDYLQQSKNALADYIGCAAEDFFLTPNPTIAINTIMRSLELQPGDEILATNHEYGAMDKTWNFFCKETGAKYVRQNISLPIISKEQILEEFWSGYTFKTKVIFINQISSCTALIFPVQEICDKARELGLLIIVDGAHVPGHIGLNIAEMNPDFYTGTLHKWMLAPKGCSFLYVKKALQNTINPLVVSWGYESEMPDANQFLENHEYQGTRDISAFLTAPAAIQFLKDNNWDEKSAQCRQLILENYQSFCDLLNTKPICPVSEEFLGQMCSIPIRTQNISELKELLYHKYQIEIPIMKIDEKIFLRISINVYNSQEDLDKLRDAIIDIKATTDLLQ